MATERLSVRLSTRTRSRESLEEEARRERRSASWLARRYRSKRCCAAARRSARQSARPSTRRTGGHSYPAMNMDACHFALGTATRRARPPERGYPIRFEVNDANSSSCRPREPTWYGCALTTDESFVGGAGARRAAQYRSRPVRPEASGESFRSAIRWREWRECATFSVPRTPFSFMLHRVIGDHADRDIAVSWDQRGDRSRARLRMAPKASIGAGSGSLAVGTAVSVDSSPGGFMRRQPESRRVAGCRSMSRPWWRSPRIVHPFRVAVRRLPGQRRDSKLRWRTYRMACRAGCQERRLSGATGSRIFPELCRCSEESDASRSPGCARVGFNPLPTCLRRA